MLNSAKAIDEKFIERVGAHYFPEIKSGTHPLDVGLTFHDVHELFNSQIKSRHLDLTACILKQKGKSFYTIGSSGHESHAGSDIEAQYLSSDEIEKAFANDSLLHTSRLITKKFYVGKR